jgi:hypothetical protein
MNTYQQRAQHLATMREALHRTAGHAQDIAERAHKRGNKTDQTRAIDLLEALTDTYAALMAALNALRDEITNHHTPKETNQ